MKVSIYLLLIICVCSYAYENIALNKPAWQLHPYSNTLYSASKAVDGRKSILHVAGNQCVVSASNQRIATWRVDLQDILSIRHVTIYYRTDDITWGSTNYYSGRFVGFTLYVSNTTDRTEGHLCVPDTNYTRDIIPAVLNVTCPVHGQYVIYYNERLQGVSYPDGYSTYAFNELCELEVYGCPSSGVYGEECSFPCPDVNCRYCHIETGACQGCNPGYKGHRCEQECEVSLYGDNCSKSCGHCLRPEQCDNINGTCKNGCKSGFQGTFCNETCMMGTFGEDCRKLCNVNCKGCDTITGICDSGCYTGWKGSHCSEECDNGRYGAACGLRCGDCLGDIQCDHVNGSCFSGCNEGFRGPMCKEGCSIGSYGKNCLEKCNTNCGVPGRCNKTSGECEGGCQPGWRGTLCDTKCGENLYGPDCNQTCGKCREGNQCHHVSGSCNEECEPGYRGNKCNEVCEFGHFGASCRQECSVFCQKSRACHHVTGVCRDGCKSGWRGNDCLEVDNQVQEEQTGNNWETMFYGILGAFCVTLVVIGVLVSLLYKMSKRHQMDRDNNKKYQASDFSSPRKEKVTQDHGNENVNSAYQELGELSPSSPYDSIH